VNAKAFLVGMLIIKQRATSFIGKMETLAWTDHLDDCLAVLDRENEYPSDAILTTLIKLQLVGEEVQKLTRSKINESNQNPIYIFKPGLVSRLSDIRNQLPDRLANNSKFRTQATLKAESKTNHISGNILMLLHSTECQVHTLGLFTEQGIIPESIRINSMYSCAKAAKSFYDSFFAISPLEVAGLPFAAYVEMSHMQAALYRLTTVEDQAWDKEILRNTVDLLYLLDKTIELFYRVDEVYAVRTDDQDGSLFTKGAKILRNLRNSWEPVLAPYLRDAALPTPNSQCPMVNTTLNAIDDTAVSAGGLVVDGVGDPTAAMDLTDITWMSDIFGPWEY
jgi:uncharacterized membrane protein